MHLCEASGSVCSVLSARFQGPKQPQSNICFHFSVPADAALSRTITETSKCPVGAVQKNRQASPPSPDRSLRPSGSAQVECQSPAQHQQPETSSVLRGSNIYWNTVFKSEPLLFSAPFHFTWKNVFFFF